MTASLDHGKSYSSNSISDATSESGTQLNTDSRQIHGRRRRRRRGGKDRKLSVGGEGGLEAGNGPLGHGEQRTIVEEAEEHPSEAVLNDSKGSDSSSPPTTKAKSGNGDLKLRLDINLDVVLELKVKIHGDITLTLL
ncbi:hypothetical protein E1B28_011843 [Marasmius oreades]|nr:uncharacterized protein E1B28_011843 [Marasmius oreades]KAG7090244.1 hypothetical protein E1B28_011843 [Marasmius oreades]